MEQYRLVTLDPGHFHASLFQKEPLPGVANESYVYAPVSADLAAHLNRIALFNNRSVNPTNWTLRVYAGEDWFDRMLADRPGTIAVLSGRNNGKIDRMLTLAKAGMHGLADKPWVIEPEDLPKIEKVIAAAKSNKVVFYDGMTQRYEITSAVLRALVNDPEVFGEVVEGSASDPAVYMESVHHLLKLVAGVPNRRPPWFFDTREQGEALTDVGTHLVDLVQWTLLPEKPIAAEQDIRMIEGRRWPTVLSIEDFQKVTGEGAFPPYLSGAVQQNKLHYFCNNSVTYALRRVHVKLDVLWAFEAPAGHGDTEFALYRGTKARIEVRNDELNVFPVEGARKPEIEAALRRAVATHSQQWPGLSVEETAEGFHVLIPAALRTGHEAHFAMVANQFLSYVENPESLPEWEVGFLKAKYFVTTQGVAMARRRT